MLKRILIAMALCSGCMSQLAAQELPGTVMPQPSPTYGVPAQTVIAPQPVPVGVPSGEAMPMPIEQRLSDLERRLSVQEQSRPPVYPVGPPSAEIPFEDTPVMASIPRGGEWKFGAGFGFSGLHLAGPEFGKYDHDGATVDINLGYEFDTGYGIRAELWGFGQGDDDSKFGVETNASTFDLDLYKRFFINYSTLTVGAGSRGADLEFRETADNTRSEFNGGGINIFGAWDHPLYIGPKWDIAFVGLGRMSILEGEWRDHTGNLIPSTNNDTMTIFEASWGLEFRRRFGQNQDKYCYFDVMADAQQWQSSWMTANVGSSAGFYGLDFDFGVAW